MIDEERTPKAIINVDRLNSHKHDFTKVLKQGYICVHCHCQVQYEDISLPKLVMLMMGDQVSNFIPQWCYFW